MTLLSNLLNPGRQLSTGNNKSRIKRWRIGRAQLISMMLTGLITSLVYIALSQYWEEQHNHHKSEALKTLSQLRATVETELNSRLNITRALAGFAIAQDELSQQQFELFAEQFGQEMSAVKSLQLAKDGIVSHVWPYEANKQALGHNLLGDPARERAARKAIESRNIWVAGPVRLLQGGVALIGRYPIFKKQQSEQSSFWGFATILIDLPAMFEQLGIYPENADYRLAVRGRDGLGAKGAVFFGQLGTFLQASEILDLRLPIGNWQIAISPTQPQQSQKHWVMVIISLLFAAPIGVVIYHFLKLPQRIRYQVKQTTHELKSNQQLFSSAIETMPAGFAIFNENNQLAQYNTSYQKHHPAGVRAVQTGVSARQLTYLTCKNSAELISELNGKPIKQADLAGLLQQTDFSYEVNIKDKWYRVLSRGMDNGCRVEFLIDYTSIKQNQIDLAKALDSAITANNTKSQFLATISHEVRTPLNAVIGLLGLLKDKHCSPNQQQQYLKTANRSAKHLLTLLNEILDISKMEAGKLELENVYFSLQDTVRNTVSLVKSKAEEKNVALDLQCPHIANDYVEGDQGRLQQVLLNLLSNAVKFTEQGKVTVKVQQTQLSDQQVRVQFSIADQGIGFSAEQAARLFEPFSQLDSSSQRRHEGTGLGLSICKKLTELMGGQIKAEGEPGKGATFSFNIPLTIAKAPAQIAAPEQATETNSSTRQYRILAAEDSPANQLVLQGMLEGTQYHLDVVSNGVEAVNAVKAFPYDLVLMDIYMPQMDGIEATKAIKQLKSTQGMPIIALTANAMKGDKSRFLLAGLDDYVAKPIDKNLLMDKLRHYLQQAELNSAA